MGHPPIHLRQLRLPWVLIVATIRGFCKAHMFLVHGHALRTEYNSLVQCAHRE